MDNLNSKMDKAVESAKKQFSSVRTNRANPDMLKNIQVEYFGSYVPLTQLSSISTPEPMLFQLNVFDNNSIKNIEKAIITSNLNLNPQVDGNIIRIRLPELTEDRRKELVRLIKSYTEDSKVAVRNIRRDQIDKIKQQEKNKEISEDESIKQQKSVQDITDKNCNLIDSLSSDKEKEILII
ncbi:ribosome recycling factor [Candidatus Marinamargulisbacteria bacterium SCGC AG-410-N11]|nr:ribosome recycling factor [Candidatus Marinamargulisbacteria bacterium SCGC AG-410-N11]